MDADALRDEGVARTWHQPARGHVQITEPGASRALSAGEQAIARELFGDAIDYGRVTVRRRRWWPLQPRNILMAPCGHLHVPPSSDAWSEDYSRERPGLQGLFLHELTHVWQSQLRGRFYLPLMRHPFCRYRYRPVIGRAFDRYGLEQQAEIVRHVFLLRGGHAVAAPASLAELEAILPFGER